MLNTDKITFCCGISALSALDQQQSDLRQWKES